MAKFDHFAILVAITRYPGISSLQGPENDALAFREWLLDPDGGDMPDENIYLLCSSDYQAAPNPYDESPTETQFKKILNGLLKDTSQSDQWKERVGERLYLFFAGHGFTAGALPNPALFTAQAQQNDPAHIAALQYAARIQNAAFFDEIVLVFDCCQDVLFSTPVPDTLWSAPNRPQRAAAVKFMPALAAPRGRQSFEDIDHSPVHGYFSSVFIDALKTAAADPIGRVTARAVQDRVLELWKQKGYEAKTGYAPPIYPPPDLVLYTRRVRTPSRRPVPPPPTATYDVVFQNPDPGAEIALAKSSGGIVATGRGGLIASVPAGRYSVRVQIGERHVTQEVVVGGKVHRWLDAVPFESAIPLPNTATSHEYHRALSLQLASELAASTKDGRGAILVFARDSKQKIDKPWSMKSEARSALRIRRLGTRSSIGEVIVGKELFFSAIALADVAPGTYLLGIRRMIGAHTYWEEVVLPRIVPGWRTEVFLDSVDDECHVRRFSAASTSVMLIPATSTGSVNFPNSRETEIDRISLSGGRMPIGAERDDLMRDVRSSPMRDLYLAYRLTLDVEPDIEALWKLCARLEELWGVSGDVQVLKAWAALNKQPEAVRREITIDDPPSIARGWELVAMLRGKARIALDLQREIGVWRTSGALWTHTVRPTNRMPRVTAAKWKAIKTKLADNPPVAEWAELLRCPDPRASPLQQALRRALIDAAADGDIATHPIVQDVVAHFAETWSLDHALVWIELVDMLAGAYVHWGPDAHL